MRAVTALLAALAAASVAVPAGGHAAAPSLGTGPAVDRTTSSATLRGSVNPEGEATTFYFEYGTSSAFGSRTEAGELPAETTTTTIQRGLTSLMPGTVYHYRAVATNASGTTFGASRTFSTHFAFSVIARPSPVTYRRAPVVQGRLEGGTVSDHRVALEARAYPFDDDFARVGVSQSTDDDGAFRLRAPRQTVPMEYRVTTFDTPPSTSEVIRVPVRARVKASVSGSTISRGSRVRFSGTVAPVRSDYPFVVQRRSGKRWVAVTRGTTAPAGSGRSRFARTVTIRRSGRYRVSVRVDSTRYLPGRSRAIRIRVR
jgi:hypothetical protein